jgi:Tol biopolymer transport system component
VSTFDRIEAGMPRLLTELADARTPDYLDTVVSRTAGSRQRPGWTFLERWLPVSVATLGGITRSTVPWRMVGLIALLLLALIGGTLLFIGSRQRPLPAPFGPALPGLVVYETDGDLYTVDPNTGSSASLLSGPTVDSQPRWSPDGTRVAFLREAGAALSTVHVLDVRSGGVSAVTPEPLGLVSSHVFSPDNRLLVVTSSRSGQDVITIFRLDGGASAEINVAGGASQPAFRPPDGRQILFVTGAAESLEGQGLAVYDVAGGAVKPVIEPIPGSVMTGRPEYSPDGTRIAYSVWVPSQDLNSRVYTANADGSGAGIVRFPSNSCCEAMPVWSNDGTRLAMTRWDSSEHEFIAIVPSDQGGEGKQFAVPGLYRGVATWSPDDRWILVTPLNDEFGTNRSPQVLLDVESGTQRPINWVSESDPSVQRLAP